MLRFHKMSSHLSLSYYAQQRLDSIEAVKDQRWCQNCWLLREVCICSRLNPIESLQNITIHLLMHFKEYKRSSNTGYLLKSLLPHNTKVYIFGLEEDWEKLLSEVNNQQVCVMYPKEDSVEVSESMNQEHLHVVVLDGTWRQARKINAKLPKEWPRVKLNLVAPSKFVSRTQTNSKGLSTIESVSMMLKKLGYQNSQNLDEAFILKDKAALRQTHKESLLSKLEQEGHYSKET